LLIRIKVNSQIYFSIIVHKVCDFRFTFLKCVPNNVLISVNL